MKIRVQALKDTLDQIEQERIKHNADQKAKYEDALSKAETKWRNEKAPKLAAELGRLAEKAHNGEIITEEDMPRSSNSYYGRLGKSLLFSASNISTPRLLHPAERHAGLRKFLDSIDDEYITSSALKDLGWVNLGRVFEQAATR